MGKEEAKHDGHRQRMLQKAKDSGLEFLPEHEQLEILLFAVIPRGNTNGIAIDLIRRFGSIAGVITAQPGELTRISGVGGRVAAFLNQLPDYLGIVQRSQMFGENKVLVLETTEEMGNYAQTLFNHKETEAFYLISLSYSGRVIRFDKISEGDVDETAVYVRRIARCAIINEASDVILVHNHPSGKLVPSITDIQRTREIVENLRVLGVSVKDHIIVSGCAWMSMREDGMMSF